MLIEITSSPGFRRAGLQTVITVAGVDPARRAARVDRPHHGGRRRYPRDHRDRGDSLRGLGVAGLSPTQSRPDLPNSRYSAADGQDCVLSAEYPIARYLPWPIARLEATKPATKTAQASSGQEGSAKRLRPKRLPPKRRRQEGSSQEGSGQARGTRDGGSPRSRSQPREVSVATDAATASGSGTPKRRLKNISEVRHFFRTNDVPIYFFGATPFNLLGLDRWVRNFSYVTYYDAWDGAHPRVFTPSTSRTRSSKAVRRSTTGC